ncbi:hypothetical protein KY361_05325 [Candidatus Woesearchaeota archaeon]|nr:hypothetical protein [Candidatus Woesearchaeota archaeon]
MRLPGGYEGDIFVVFYQKDNGRYVAVNRNSIDEIIADMRGKETIHWRYAGRIPGVNARFLAEAIRFAESLDPNSYVERIELSDVLCSAQEQQ